MAGKDNKKPITFILSDESINESGFRVDTAGIDIKQFKLNPIMFYNHQRSNEWSQPDILPIGKWENIRKKDGELLADAVFDMDDEFAVKIAKKVEKGMLNAASIGFNVLVLSEDPSDLKQGQKRPTVKKSKLKEASIVDIPRNGNALKLTYQGRVVQLGLKDSEDELDTILPLIKNSTKMKTVYNFLKLGGEPSEAEVLAAITTLSNTKIEQQQKITSLETEIEKLKSTQEEDKCVALVNKAISDKKITESQRESWLNLAKNGYDNAAAALKGMTGFTSLSGEVDSKDSEGKSLGDADKYEKKMKADELLAWKQKSPEEFERCENAYLELSE